MAYYLSNADNIFGGHFDKSNHVVDHAQTSLTICEPMRTQSPQQWQVIAVVARFLNPALTDAQGVLRL
jgi:hypothetical protein